MTIIISEKERQIALRDRFEERAAILEFDAGTPRKDAEVLAWQEIYGQE